MMGATLVHAMKQPNMGPAKMRGMSAQKQAYPQKDLGMNVPFKDSMRRNTMIAADGMHLSRMASTATMQVSTLDEVQVEETYEVNQLEKET